ncbi:hemolysin family protein [Lacisediminimonas profundi]|uniref:hemolysin family protein n=1 Tax=Lacisediminimonas profundi TaxID=2603856 RepID=UPI00124B9571|nr:hemolysin family protein [Lacisediminimonas profundi]
MNCGETRQFTLVDILIIIGLILLNGVFAMSELAIVSSRRIRLERLSENGSRGALAALQLAESPSHFLSTVQVGITLIGIFNGAFGEASLVAQLTPQLAGVPFIGPYSREISLGVVVLGITFASIIFGELVPKRIALLYPETVAMVVSGPMQWLSRIMAPFVKVLSVTTEFVMRVLGLHKARDNQVTEEEIAGMLREGTNAGLFEKTEHDMVTRALRLDDLRLGALMTPRADVEFIDLDEPLADVLAKIAESPYNRFPVYRGDMSNLIGIVHAGDLFEQAIRNNSLSAIDIAAVTRPPMYVPESLSGMDLLETLKKHRSELALVVDEYGDIEGMVTLSDVMSALVGDVSVVDEGQEADAVKREDGSWLIDGGVSLDRFRDLLETEVRFPDESSGAYHTLAGFVLTQLRRIPNVSEHFEWDDYRFEVVDMDRNRIDRLLVTRIAKPDEPVPEDG